MMVADPRAVPQINYPLSPQPIHVYNSCLKTRLIRGTGLLKLLTTEKRFRQSCAAHILGKPIPIFCFEWTELESMSGSACDEVRRYGRSIHFYVRHAIYSKFRIIQIFLDETPFRSPSSATRVRLLVSRFGHSCTYGRDSMFLRGSLDRKIS